MYDAQLGRWHVIDPLVEKYYAYSPYIYSINDPILFNDPDGRDIDPSRVKGKEHLTALKTFLSTKDGYRFFAQFAHKGQSIKITIDGKTTVFKFDKEGKRANDLLAVASQDANKMLSADGYTRTFFYQKGDKTSIYGKSLKEATETDDISKGVITLLDISLSNKAIPAVNTMAHEAFVHANKNLQALDAIQADVKAGNLKPGTKDYVERLKAATGQTRSDHESLGKDNVSEYKNISAQMDKLNNTKIYTELYKEDVRQHSKPEE